MRSLNCTETPYHFLKIFNIVNYHGFRRRLIITEGDWYLGISFVFRHRDASTLLFVRVESLNKCMIFVNGVEAKLTLRGRI